MLPKEVLLLTICIQIPITMVGEIILIFHGGLKMLRILRPSPVDLPLLVSKTRDMLLLLPIQLHQGALKLIR